MGSGATCMDDPFRRTLMIEVRDLFAQDEIFKQSRAAHSSSQGVLIVGNRKTLIGGQWNFTGRGLLVGFSAFDLHHRDCRTRWFRFTRFLAWHLSLILSRSPVFRFGVDTRKRLVPGDRCNVAGRIRITPRAEMTPQTPCKPVASRQKTGRKHLKVTDNLD
jgi:hypothetical protein